MGSVAKSKKASYKSLIICSVILLLVPCILFVMIVVDPFNNNKNVLAIDTDWYYGDPTKGSAGAPFEIGSAAELAGLAKIVNEDRIGFFGKSIILTDNINLSAYGAGFNGRKGWIPIGLATPFQGTFSGNGFVISNLCINSDEQYAGLFGRVSGVIKDVGLENINIITSQERVGGIAARLDGGGRIENCYTTGSIVGASYIGGIVGETSSALVLNCYSSVSVIGASHTGGIVGNSWGDISGCFATGSVEGIADVGGIVGTVANGRIVSGCVALNPSVVNSASNNFGRVAGNLGGAILANNLAFDRMLDKNNFFDTWNKIGMNDADGSSISLVDIVSDPTLGGTFTGDGIWTITPGQLPKLHDDVNVDIPVHILTLPGIVYSPTQTLQTLAASVLPAGFSWEEDGTIVPTAGNPSFKASFLWNTEKLFFDLKIPVSKAHAELCPNYSDPQSFVQALGVICYSPDKLLADISLPTGWMWDYPDTAITSAGAQNHSATYTPIDTDNYESKILMISFTVSKAPAEQCPGYSDPQEFVEALGTITYSANKTLADILLPIAWAWDNPEIAITSVGDKNYSATYTPLDPDNYESKTLSISFTVSKAPAEDDPAYTEPNFEAMVYNPARTLADVTLPTGWAWDDETIVPTVINAGYSATYTPSSDNYEGKTKDIVLTINPMRLVKPFSLKTQLKHTGKQKTLVFVGFDSATMSIEGNTATKAGIYSAVIKLIDNVNYSWEDGSADDIVVEWSIVKAKWDIIDNLIWILPSILGISLFAVLLFILFKKKRKAAA